MRYGTRKGLVAELAVVCGCLVALFAVLVAFLIRGDVQRESVRNAVQAARLAAGGPIAQQLKRGAYAGPILSVADQRLFDGIVSRARRQVAIDRLIVRDPSGRILFSDDHRLIGRTVGASSGLRAALGGATIYRALRDSERPPFADRGPKTVVWAPLPGDGGLPANALELWIAKPVLDRAAARDRHGAYGRIAGLSFLLWLALVAVAYGATVRLLRTLNEREQRAQSDPLTGLANRAMFQDVLNASISHRRRASGAVLLMDLDRFKDVNDTLGHHNGDLLLERIASRLASALPVHATVARLGGDEFAILLPDVVDRQAVAGIARRIHRNLEEPVVVGGLALQVDASLGIALFPEHGREADEVLRAADVAMYVAKEQHSGHEFYEPSVHGDRHDAARLTLIGELRRAMDEAELVLHYQPTVDLRTGAPCSVEALARWNHPELGTLSPAEFIPLAERSNFQRPMTLYLLDAALRRCVAWRKHGVPIRVGVNLSMQTLLDLRFAGDLEHLLEMRQAPPAALELEVTESAIMADPRRAQALFGRLRKLGVRIAVDDFGTGYSSLAHLQSLKVDAIKIDRSFVGTMEEREGSRTIVESTIELGHGLGLEVVAEGVETLATFNRLTELGCDYAQGYFLSRPLDEQRMTTWLGVMAGAEEALEAWRPEGALALPDALTI